MKKITFIAILILMAGMFVGCASTNKKSRNLNKYWSTPEKYWEKEIIKDLTEIMNQSVITKEDEI